MGFAQYSLKAQSQFATVEKTRVSVVYLEQKAGVLAGLGLQQNPVPCSGSEHQTQVPWRGDGHVVLQVPPQGTVTQEAVRVWHYWGDGWEREGQKNKHSNDTQAAQEHKNKLHNRRTFFFETTKTVSFHPASIFRPVISPQAWPPVLTIAAQR